VTLSCRGLLPWFNMRYTYCVRDGTELGRPRLMKKGYGRTVFISTAGYNVLQRLSILAVLAQFVTKRYRYIESSVTHPSRNTNMQVRII
jgi:hypothetical protein